VVTNGKCLHNYKVGLEISFQCTDALIHPHIEYANQVQYSHTKKHILAIQNVQPHGTQGRKIGSPDAWDV